jgi:outer membrane murein-binding lipoprotein Lpp
MKLVKKLLVVALPLVFVAGCATQESIDKANQNAAQTSATAEKAAMAAEMAAKAAAQAARAAERASAEAKAAGDKVDRIFRKGLRK